MVAWIQNSVGKSTKHSPLFCTLDLISTCSQPSSCRIKSTLHYPGITCSKSTSKICRGKERVLSSTDYGSALLKAKQFLVMIATHSNLPICNVNTNIIKAHTQLILFTTTLISTQSVHFRECIFIISECSTAEIIA